MFFGLWGVSVPLAYVFGLRIRLGGGTGLVGVWWGLIAGYSVMTLVMIGFVVHSDWDRYAADAQSRSETADGTKPLLPEALNLSDSQAAEATVSCSGQAMGTPAGSYTPPLPV